MVPAVWNVKQSFSISTGATTRNYWKNADGYGKGESDLLLKQVRQKLERGKSIPVIAEELETEVVVIEEIAERIKNMVKPQ